MAKTPSFNFFGANRKPSGKSSAKGSSKSSSKKASGKGSNAWRSYTGGGKSSSKNFTIPD